MDINRQLELATQSLRHLAASTHFDAHVRLAALDQLSEEIAARKGLIWQELDAKIGALKGTA